MIDLELHVYDTSVDVQVGAGEIAIELPYGIPGPPGEADKRIGGVLLTDPAASSIAAGNSKAYIQIPPELNGFSLVAVSSALSTAATSGVTTITMRRVRPSVADVFMLSTPVTIDANEKTSETAAVPPVINNANRTVQTGDQIHFDITAAGVGASGAFINFTFRQI